MNFLKKNRGVAMAAAMVAMLAGGEAVASGGISVPSQDWSFSGMFGSYDRASAQRGLQVYREVCSSCHGLGYIAFRNLEGLGYSEDDVKAMAATYDIGDGPNDDGDMFTRSGIPADRFPDPFENDMAAKASNGGALPPDLSLIVDARAGGADYVYAFLTGFEDPAPAGSHIPEGKYYNHYFAGHAVSMPPQLFEDQVEYADGTPATTEQMAKDITTFLAWASEPNMEERKQMGIKVILFLVAFSLIFFAIKRRVWADVDH